MLSKKWGRPSEVGLQELISNRCMRLQLRVAVVSDTLKGSFNCQVTIQKATAKEPLIRCRNKRDDVKTWYFSLPGISLRITCLLLRWHPAYRWRELYRGF